MMQFYMRGNSNFSVHQIGVPMIWHVPGQQANQGSSSNNKEDIQDADFEEVK